MPDDQHTRQRKAPRFKSAIPDGDTRERSICESCDFIHYVNPKIVAGAVAVHDGKILLCRRAIEPRAGYWTIPAGYMELNETVEDAAKREAREEAGADLELGGLLAIYSIPRLSQVQLFFKARLLSPQIAAGEESLEVALFEFNEIPWDNLAFPSVNWALNHYWSVRSTALFAPFSNPPGNKGEF